MVMDEITSFPVYGWHRMRHRVHVRKIRRRMVEECSCKEMLVNVEEFNYLGSNVQSITLGYRVEK